MPTEPPILPIIAQHVLRNPFAQRYREILQRTIEAAARFQELEDTLKQFLARQELVGTSADPVTTLTIFPVRIRTVVAQAKMNKWNYTGLRQRTSEFGVYEDLLDKDKEPIVVDPMLNRWEEWNDGTFFESYGVSVDPNEYSNVEEIVLLPFGGETGEIALGPVVQVTQEPVINAAGQPTGDVVYWFEGPNPIRPVCEK